MIIILWDYVVLEVYFILCVIYNNKLICTKICITVYKFNLSAILNK